MLLPDNGKVSRISLKYRGINYDVSLNFRGRNKSCYCRIMVWLFPLGTDLKKIFITTTYVCMRTNV